VQLATRTMDRDGQRRYLTRLENELLAHLVQRTGVPVSRGELLTEVWGYSSGANTQTLESTVRRLRRKLEAVPSRPRHVLSVYGVGYRFEALPTTQRRSVPAPTDLFVGRSEELSRLARMVDRSSVVVVHGAGGIGKTRLTLEFARHRPGVAFCGLAGVRTSEQVLDEIADAFSVPRTADPGSLADLLARSPIRLAILDNAEHVIDELRTLLPGWLTALPKLTWLVTSRTRPGIRGESLLEVGPLEAREAQQLFAERTAEAGGPHDVDPAVAMGVATALEGIPLAIELAAAQTNLLSPEQVLARLQNLITQLGPRNTPQRQATLAATIEWSWGLLQPWERDAIAQCSVFSDGFFLDAAEGVLDLSHHADAPPIFDVLGSLRDQSMLRISRPPCLHENRYGIFDSIRTFAAAQLPTHGAAARHADWYARRITLASPNHLQCDASNMREAAAHLLQTDPDRAADLLVAMHTAVGESVHQHSDAVAEMVDTWEAGQDGNGADTRRCRLWLLRAGVAFQAGRPRAAAPRIDRAIVFANLVGDRQLHAQAQLERARLDAWLGDAESARARCRQVLSTSLPPLTIALAGRRLAMITEDQRKAWDLLEFAERSSHTHGDVAGRARALVGLAQLALLDGEPKVALRTVEQALVIHQQRQSRHGLAEGCLVKSDIERSANRLDAARFAAVQARALVPGDGPIGLMAELRMALVDIEAGELEDANKRLDSLIQRLALQHASSAMRVVWLALAKCASLQGNHRQSSRYVKNARNEQADSPGIIAGMVCRALASALQAEIGGS